MNTKLSALFTLAMLTFFSCGNASKETNLPGETPKEDKTKHDKTGTPCELFTLDDLKAAFSIHDSINIEVDDTDHTFPTCSYDWNTGRKSMMKIQKMEIEVDVANNVLIVMVENVSMKMYERSISIYPETSPVEIGEIGVWSDKRSQLSFLNKGYLIHVHVRAFDDIKANKDKAVWLAKEISAKL